MIRLALVLVVALALSGGCATVVAPHPVSDSVPVYLTDYGRHSSVLISTAPGQLQEYAYGDWDWFAENRMSKTGAVRAMLFSRGPTLGRRQLNIEGGIEAVRHATGAAVVHHLQAPRARADALVRALDEQYNRELNTVTYNVLSDMWFVRADRHYSVWHNCNHATADWLEALGCDVRGMVMFSKFKVRP